VIEVGLDHEALKFLLSRTPVEKLVRAEVANNGKVQKQRVAQ
jgi:hypothetical protein